MTASSGGSSPTCHWPPGVWWVGVISLWVGCLLLRPDVGLAQCTWSGTFQTTFDITMTLSEASGQVNGSYTFNNGANSGTISGTVRTEFPGYTVLDGYWREPNEGGRIWFTMPLDPCTEFTGQYTDGDASDQWIDGWNGTRTSGGDRTIPAVFTKQLPAGELAGMASATFEQLVATADPDPVGTLVMRLQANPAVAQVERFEEDGSVVGVTTNDSAFSVSVAEQSRPEWQEASAATSGGLVQSAADVAPQSEGITCHSITFPQSKTACIVALFQEELRPLDLLTISVPLGKLGFTVAELPLATPAQMKDLKSRLSTCGVFYIHSHGVITRNEAGTLGNHLATEILTGLPDQDAFRQRLAEMIVALGGDGAGGAADTNAIADYERFFGIYGHNGLSYYTLAPEFFASVTYPNTLVYADACSSDSPITVRDPVPVLVDSRLRRAFRDNGAGAFIGWSAPVRVGLANAVADAIFDELAPDATNIESVTLVAPSNPPSGQPYVPQASVSPAQAGVELLLTVIGSDDFRRDDRGTTDANGQVMFSPVPGGAGGVVDTLTVSAGGAQNTDTVVAALKALAELNNPWTLPWLADSTSIVDLNVNLATADYNLVCNNPRLVQQQAVVKF